MPTTVTQQMPPLSWGLFVGAIGLTGLILWAFRKGDKLASVRAHRDQAKSEIEALEARNEAYEETAGDSDSDVDDFLRSFEGSGPDSE